MNIPKENPAKGLVVGAAFGAAFWFCISLAGASLLTGCESPENWLDELEDHFHSSDPATTETGASHSESAEASATVAGSETIVYRFGGFDGGRAAEDPATQIRAFKMSASGMSYAWAKGGCENFGAKDRSDADHALACIFYWDAAGGRWVGGKFDWISSSRTTRDFVNIRTRYNGWDPDAFFAASRHAFCIVSKDGRRRTNLLTE